VSPGSSGTDTHQLFSNAPLWCAVQISNAKCRVALHQGKLSERTCLESLWRKRSRIPGLIPVSRRAGPAGYQNRYTYASLKGRACLAWIPLAAPCWPGCRDLYTSTHALPTLASTLTLTPTPGHFTRSIAVVSDSREMTHIEWDIRAAIHLWRDEIRARA
jgi:hypothetical protein